MNAIDHNNLLAELESLERDAAIAFASAEDAEALERARVAILGQRSGRLGVIEAAFKSLPPAAKKVVGKRFNELKGAVQRAFEAAKGRAALSPTQSVPTGFDFSVPGLPVRIGTRHPLTQTADELVDIFGRFGFSLADGPEIEDEWHNFEALNIPAAHPARDPNDNFYIDDRRLLRSQTSTVQIRIMERQPPPVRVVAIGRVYRPDEHDATHFSTFHQIEGLYVDRHVTLADLKTVLRLFAATYLGRDVRIRFRPSFFPFTEPSVEVDMSWDLRGGKWIELGGAGMVDPNVFRAVGYDPEQYSGFAFGLGIERMCMRRHAMNDIRMLYENDVRFLRQF